MLVFLLAVSGKNVLSFRSCILLGAAIGLLPLIKIAYGINAFFFFLYAVRLFMRKRIALTGAIIVAVELLASALVLSGLNLIRFGTLFESGYGSEAARFSASLLPGLLGFLFSPSKSVFIYSPLIILCMAASGAMFKRNPGIVLLIWLLTIANLMLYSFWYGWEGGWSWGPRFMVPYVVLLHVFLAEVILRSRENKVYRWGLRILLVPSVLISLLGATISYQQVYTVFNEDYWSIGNAQPLIAITLWMHKGTGARELYTCTDFHVDPAHLSAGPLHELLRPDGTIDMEGRKTFRGLFTMWEGLYHTFGWHWARFFPILLLATAFYLWRLTIAAAYRQMTST